MLRIWQIILNYGENDNFATFTNKTKHKAMRGPIDVGECGEQKLMNKNLISSAVQTFDVKLEMFISGVLMI